MLSVFLLGATGYLGGTILTNLEGAGSYSITCLVRPNRESCMRNRKAKVLLGSHADLERIEATSADSDIVINAATSDDLELTKAINRGLATRRGQHGRRGVLVHISGTQLIESAPTGVLEPVPKYDDLDLAQIEAIPDSALHRLIDLEVARADAAGELVGSIVCPGVIFGRGSGPAKTISSPFPRLVRLALREKQVVYAGDGTNIWAHVHVDDVCSLVTLSMRQNLDLAATDAPGVGFGRFYFAEFGEHQKLDICTKMAAILHAKGLVNTTDTRAVLPDSPEAPDWPNKTTSRCFANRARKELGWTPKLVLEDMFEAEILDLVSAVQEETRNA